MLIWYHCKHFVDFSASIDKINRTQLMIQRTSGETYGSCETPSFFLNPMAERLVGKPLNLAAFSMIPRHGC